MAALPVGADAVVVGAADVVPTVRIESKRCQVIKRQHRCATTDIPAKLSRDGSVALFCPTPCKTFRSFSGTYFRNQLKKLFTYNFQEYAKIRFYSQTHDMATSSS